MSDPAPIDPETTPSTAETAPAGTPHAAHGEHPDPITGEPHAHPVGVGVGAMGAGAVGAAIGAFLGPIGIVAGAAIGAIAGGLAGKEVAEEPEISPTEIAGGEPLDEFDRPAASTTGGEMPLSSTLAERTEPADDTFFTGGTVGSHIHEPAADRLDEFDQPHAGSATTPVATVPASASTGLTAASSPGSVSDAAPTTNIFDDDKPLPTASSGLITPDESSAFADSTTGESSILAESPLPEAFAVNAEGSSESTGSFSSHSGHHDTERTIRTAAYYRYLDREVSHEPGTDVEDWLKAEKEVLNH